ncbi:transmembrane protein, putative (macronuclear) [Tetrahymena thermophila SB210]|uniref:Transmembrane protein, putative n=1 Tax=Tetrahymena thermophila (strain SB210) TaxID=312017 RepID=W7XLI9_TETTS|nr:transmembrane protein, putative [Tetrahymena thermophila SB210]EWS76369.1 transmembrane protein, putative [Tetrahymena thermophila SB210]|eukprot:XP_012651153.1 transmembrane protein, putative [Tetrahymena thermophila SB210]
MISIILKLLLFIKQQFARFIAFAHCCHRSWLSCEAPPTEQSIYQSIKQTYKIFRCLCVFHLFILLFHQLFSLLSILNLYHLIYFINDVSQFYFAFYLISSSSSFISLYVCMSLCLSVCQSIFLSIFQTNQYKNLKAL